MRASIEVEGRFNGPRRSGNGGYCAGLLAAFVDGPAETSLLRPVPLDRPLDVVDQAGGAVRALDGDALIAEARPAPTLEIEVPEPVDVAQAHAATTLYHGLADGEFCRCFVCGRAREDAQRVYAGPVAGRPLVATPWTPPAWTADADGHVRPEIVWAVLDCPTYFAAYAGAESTVSFLVSQATRIDAPVRAGEEHVVIGWPIEVDGRKRRAGSAVLSADGEPLAVARVLMVEPRSG